MKQDFNQFKELPAPLPVRRARDLAGQALIQGAGAALVPHPRGRDLFRRPDAVEVVVELVAWRVGGRGRDIRALADRAGHQRHRGARGLAWLFRRAACYTITSKRVLFQFGVALPMTMNIPLEQDRQCGVENLSRWLGRYSAQAQRQPSAFPMCCCGRISVRGAYGCPSRCCVRCRMPRFAAAKLSEALTGQPGPAAVALPQSAGRELVAGAAAHIPLNRGGLIGATS